MKKWYDFHCPQLEIGEWVEAESISEAEKIMYEKIKDNIEYYVDLEAFEVVEDHGDEYYEQEKISEE